MKNLVRNLFFIGFFLALSTALSSFSCQDEEELDCDAIYANYLSAFSKAEAASDEADQALANNQTVNCTKLESAFNEFFDVLRQGKNCFEIKSEVEEISGSEDVEVLINLAKEQLTALTCNN